jgi:hypothetical protein
MIGLSVYGLVRIAEVAFGQLETDTASPTSRVCTSAWPARTVADMWLKKKSASPSVSATGVGPGRA